MSYKTFSVAQTAPGKSDSPDKSKEAPPTGQPTTPPDQKPAEAAPAPKS